MTTETHSSYHAASTPHGLEAELRRLRFQALLSWSQEARILQGLGLAPGMRVLELGSGPGFITAELAALVPAGEVLALEIDPELQARARAYLAAEGVTNWRPVRANAMATGLAPASVDFVYARYLFQHLPDPIGAAREAARVLRPGGTLAVFDVDDGLVIFDPPPAPAIAPITDRLEAAHRAEQAARGGNRLIGRRLPHLLRDAGFDDLVLSAVATHNLVADLSSYVRNRPRRCWRPPWRTARSPPRSAICYLADSAAFFAGDPAILLVALVAAGRR